MAEGKKKKIVVFLDASVLVAAALSPTGGSFRVLAESPLRGIALVTSRYAYSEAEANIQDKYPNLLSRLYELAAFFQFVDEADKKLLEQCIHVIDFKDAPVLAAALNARVDILLTLDRKHFINNPHLEEKNFPLKIFMPGDFISTHFR